MLVLSSAHLERLNELPSNMTFLGGSRFSGGIEMKKKKKSKNGDLLLNKLNKTTSVLNRADKYWTQGILVL